MGKSPNQGQTELFRSRLVDIINPEHELVKLATEIDWKGIENHFSPLYSAVGQPSKPVRLMVGLLKLKSLYNLSDENLIGAWIQNPYMQYFCGEVFFSWKQPCDPTELIYFRKRIGKDGCERLLKSSIDVHGQEFHESDELIVDTFVQEKNITYPTETKMNLRAIEHMWDIIDKEGVEIRQSYRRTVSKLKKQLRRNKGKAAKAAKKARKKIRNITGRLHRELMRKLGDALYRYDDLLGVIGCLLEQQFGDVGGGNKIYSLHEPHVNCIAKGKAGKKYEYGNKVSVTQHNKSGLMVGVDSFATNPYDGHTLPGVLQTARRITGLEFKVAIVDGGYRGSTRIGNTEIVLPDNGKGLSQAQREEKKRQLTDRAAIEPRIGHLKTDHRVGRNFLKGIIGDHINAIMGAVGFNLKKRLNFLKKRSFFWLKTKIVQIWTIISLANQNMPTLKKMQLIA